MVNAAPAWPPFRVGRVVPIARVGDPRKDGRPLFRVNDAPRVQGGRAIDQRRVVASWALRRARSRVPRGPWPLEPMVLCQHDRVDQAR